MCYGPRLVVKLGKQPQDTSSPRAKVPDSSESACGSPLSTFEITDVLGGTPTGILRRGGNCRLEG